MSVIQAPRRMLGLMYRICGALAGRPTRIPTAVGCVPRFISEAVRYRRLTTDPRFAIGFWDLYPQLLDYRDQAGSADGHYVHQDLWAARKVWKRNPPRHVDIGSRVDGFITHLLSFRTVEVMDIRPLDSSIDGLCFVQDDATHLGRFEDRSLPSVSTLHAAEHFGLGRYGDPLDPNAPFLYLRSTEARLGAGRTSLLFDSNRTRTGGFQCPPGVRSADHLDAFDGLELVSFSAIDDDGAFVPDARLEALRSCNYACGLFEFAKPEAGPFPSVA